MGRWLPVIVEGLRRALPWVLDVLKRRVKGDGLESLPALKRIEHDVERLHAKFDVQEKHLAALWEELGKLNKRP